jgi:hypothetical protein
MPPVLRSKASALLKIQAKRAPKLRFETKEKRTKRIIEEIATYIRPKLPRHANISENKPPRYFSNPVYGKHSKAAGGTSVHTQIGPGQGEIGNYGSTPDGDTPTSLTTLRRDYASFGWVAGHLLNDNLGGPGTAINLTPLTTAGNKNHLVQVETRVKDAITGSWSRTLLFKSDQWWYGVEYSVRVSDDAWPDMPEFVPISLIVSAKVIRQDKQSKVIDDAPAGTTPSYIYFEPLSEVLIDNTGYVASDTVRDMSD